MEALHFAEPAGALLVAAVLVGVALVAAVVLPLAADPIRLAVRRLALTCFRQSPGS